LTDCFFFPKMKIDNMRKPKTSPAFAATGEASEWGKRLAAHLRARGENNPFLLAAQFGWRVILEQEEETCPGAPLRIAEWDGSCRVIRVFMPVLRRSLGDSALALHRACAHELFHGLAARGYRALQLPAAKLPSLNYRDEEIAAQIFSDALFFEEKSCPLSASR
jgi:hypothetical protein